MINKDNWKKFYFESNMIFKWIKNMDDWEEVKEVYSDMTEEELLSSKRCDRNGTFGLRSEHDSSFTLRDFMEGEGVIDPLEVGDNHSPYP